MIGDLNTTMLKWLSPSNIIPSRSLIFEKPELIDMILAFSKRFPELKEEVQIKFLASEKLIQEK